MPTSSNMLLRSTLMLAVALAGAIASAQEQARVLSVTPIVRSTQAAPPPACSNEPTTQDENAPAQQAATCDAPATTAQDTTTSYSVDYEYAGKRYTVELPYDPGPTLTVSVQPVVTPAPGASATAPATATQTVVTVPVYVPYRDPFFYPPFGYYPYAPFSVRFGFGYHARGWRHR